MMKQPEGSSKNKTAAMARSGGGICKMSFKFWNQLILFLNLFPYHRWEHPAELDSRKDGDDRP